MSSRTIAYMLLGRLVDVLVGAQRHSKACRGKHCMNAGEASSGDVFLLLQYGCLSSHIMMPADICILACQCLLR